MHLLNTMNDTAIEREANYFAMCLLMPENLVRQEVQKLARSKRHSIDICDDQWVKELAKQFRVPITLMAIRIGQVFPELKNL